LFTLVGVLAFVGIIHQQNASVSKAGVIATCALGDIGLSLGQLQTKKDPHCGALCHFVPRAGEMSNQIRDNIIDIYHLTLRLKSG